jgi:two-component system, chemotaxis family, CheB/CheR fusion protein
MPVDFFLRSLAQECGGRATCVILSGTGSDGSAGLKAVKGKGGLVIVQDPDEAAYDGMSRSAVATGLAEFVLRVERISEVIIQHSRQSSSGHHPGQSTLRVGERDGLTGIIELLRMRTPHNFALYKQGTLRRRIERRMTISAIDDFNAYLELLRGDARELGDLAKDLLIHVTSFFRNNEVFALLARTTVPELVRLSTGARTVRIWVPGCSTGEEVYSLAMLFTEEIAATNHHVKLEIFGSDVDEAAVAFARNGLYPDTIRAQLSQRRLSRFFVREEKGYRIIRELRDTIAFTVHDVLTSAPFVRIDLLSCRNLLIYLRPDVQENLLGLFSFALRPGGTLLLGTSETVGNITKYFEPYSKRQGVYLRTTSKWVGAVKLPLELGVGDASHEPLTLRQATSQSSQFVELSHRLLLEAYAPASVLIDHRLEALYYHGSTDRYLQVASGKVTSNLLDMARKGLRERLMGAIRQARQSNARTVASGARVDRGGSSVAVRIDVQPIQTEGQDLLLISFLDELVGNARPKRASGPPADASRIAELERELEISWHEHEDTVRELERSNEDLRASNEEAVSLSEEHQSTSEELEASKEELRSLNEQLMTLNGQLRETIERQRASFDDRQNILNSSDVAMVFLDRVLNIRFFTPAAKSLFSIMDSDVGRPLADFTRRFPERGLLADARAVLAGSQATMHEIGIENGAWYIQRVLPYRTHDDRVEGVILTFTDVSEMKAAEREIRTARAYAESVVDTVRQPLVVLDDNLLVLSASRPFCCLFVIEPDAIVGRPLWAADPSHLNVPTFHTFLDLIRSSRVAVTDYEIEVEVRSLGQPHSAAGCSAYSGGTSRTSADTCGDRGHHRTQDS